MPVCKYIYIYSGSIREILIFQEESVNLEMARNGTWAIDEKIIPLVNVTVEGIAVWFLPFSAYPGRVNPRVR